MKLSRLFGILSVVLWLLAILTVVLPVASLLSGGIGITSNQASSGSTTGGIPTSYKVSNRGFLALNGVYLNVRALYPNGTQLYSVTVGPTDIPPGVTVPMNIATSNLTSFSGGSSPSVAGVTSISLKATATANLGGLIPISATADFTVPLNSSRTAPGG